MAREGDTKDRILDEAQTLFQERGYNGFSYKHISERLGVRNAAVHYHYPAKADLGEAMVHRFRERFAQWVQHLDNKYHDNPVKLLDGFITIPRSYMKRSDMVCPLGVLESNFNILPEPMQRETRHLGRDMRSWLTELLEMGRQTGVFSFDGPAADKSLMISAALQGASIMASAESPALFETTVKQIKRELGILK